MILHTSLISFKAVLKQLREQLENNRKHQLITTHIIQQEKGSVSAVLQAAEELRRGSTQEKEYLYRSNVITLYGAIEHFVESLVEEYIGNVHLILPRAEQLNQDVVNHYLDFGYDILGKAERSGKFKDLSKIDIVESLYDTLKTNKTHLMKEFFISSGGGNYNHNEIMNCFVRLGVKNVKQNLRSEEPLSSFFLNQFGADYAGLDDEILFQLIDDLVARRNDLAHGGNNISMLNDGDFTEYIDYAEKYAEALCNVLRKDLAGHQWHVSSQKELKATNVYNNEIACFHVSGETFMKDSFLLYQTAGDPARYGFAKILSIQVNNIDYSSYTCEEITSIGCKLDIKITNHFTFKNTR